jgi:hypothetical protein
VIVAQRVLFSIVKEIYEGEEVVEEYTHIAPHWPAQKMQLDVYVPSKKMAFEYQGHQHYHSSHFWGKVGDREVRDQRKIEACIASGIVLVQVPYWWDTSKDHLLEILAEVTSASKYL